MGQDRIRLGRAVRAFDRTLEGAACALLVMLLVTVLLGVVSRAANDPLIWTDEGARFLMVWLAAFSWMIAGRRQAHVRIRYFQALLPPTLFRGAESLIQAALMVLGLVIAWFGVTLVRRNLELEATSLPLSMALLYLPIVPAGVMMAMQAMMQLFGRASNPAAMGIGETRIE